jgi:ABC-type transport system involved in multi-copper enzyme maturation permease subunit
MTPFTNPVLIKELRGRMRGNRAMIILTIYLSIIGIVTLLVYLAMVSRMSFGSSGFETGRMIGRSIFTTVMIMALAQVCIITPSLTSGSIAGEKERQSYDLLITTLLSPWQIVLGKLMAALSFALLLILSVLPLAGLSFLFGGVSGIELVLGMIGLVVTAVLYASVGLLWSTLMRGTLGATVMAQGTVLLWLLGVPFLALIFGTIFVEHNFFNDFMDTPFAVYLVGTVLCSHPFIALGITQVQLSSGENPFFFTMDIGRGGGVEVLAPSPWLAYTVIALIFTLVFLLISMRMLVPLHRGAGRQRLPRPKPANADEPVPPPSEQPENKSPG